MLITLVCVQVAPYTQWNQKGVNLAKEQGTPVLVTEYNSISCGGSNISDTVCESTQILHLIMLTFILVCSSNVGCRCRAQFC